MFRDAERGFTLVELSIVLVIIGLLIGGILLAQSMTSAAKLTAQVRQIQQFDAAVENFKTKYNYLPGDAPAFGGDGDGLITMGANEGWKGYVNSYAGEITNFWHDLFLDQYASSPVPSAGSIPEIAGPNRNVPAAKLGSLGSFVMASAIRDQSNSYTATADMAKPRNYYAIIPASSIPTTTTPTPGCCYQLISTKTGHGSLTAGDEAALDTKIDDSSANSGNVLAGILAQPDGGSNSGALSSEPLATCSNGAAYQIQNPSYECIPLIRMGAQTGDLN